MAVAAAEGEAAARDLDAARLRVAGAAALAHQQALAAGAVAAARREALAVAEDVLVRARSLVRAGRVEEGILPALLAEVGRLRVAVADAERDERTALRRLERVLARPPGSVTGVAGRLVEAPALPAPADADFARHPEVAALRAAQETARVRTRSAEALATPDVTVGLSVETSREVEQSATTVGVGVELPLPVFDRNQGAIRAARADERRAAAATADALARISGDYAEAYEEIVSLRGNLATYDDEILPALRDDLERAKAAEAAGRTDRGPVLDARAALAASRTIRAELAARLAARTVDALTLLDRLP